MANPVTITVGVVTTAVKSGLNALKGQFTSLREFANGELAGALVGGGLVATLGQIIEKAGQITDISQRFGVIPEKLQEITNAAEPNGASMEDVASALNKTALSQEKVRKGGAELRDTLKGLGVDAEAFVNASPEEAFYMLSDAVKNAEDRTAAYGAVVEIMGKKSGVLFTTIEQGSEAIKQQGQAVGVMSNEAVGKLDDLGDTFTNMKNTLFAWGAEAISFVIKVVQSVGGIIGGIIVYWEGMFGTIGRAMSAAFKGNFAEAGKELKEFGKDLVGMGENSKTAFEAAGGVLKDTWNPEKDDDGKKKPKRGLEELESEASDRSKLMEIYESINQKKLELQNKELEGEARINDLIARRNKIYADAAGETDAMKQAKMWEKAIDVEKEIMTLRQQADKDAEARADRIAKKREQLENKQLDQSLNGMTDENKLKTLEEWQRKLREAAKLEPDEEKRLDIAGEFLDNQSKIDALKKKDNKVELVTSTLGKIGGGGGAFARRDDGADKITTAVTQVKTETVKARQLLEKIEKKTGKALWNP